MHDDDHGSADYGSADYGSFDYGSADYGSADDGSVDYGSTDYGCASDSVSELPRSFIGISRFRELPIPASAHIGNRPSPQAPPSRRAYAHARPCVHMQMLPRADAVPLPHG